MPNISPYAVCLGDADRAELESVTRRGTAPCRLVLRARIVLLAAGGLANPAIAARLGVCEDTARKWRRRYCQSGMGGLADAPRPGRPRKFPARVVAEVKALACELPAASGRPLARWTCPELARQSTAGPSCASRRSAAAIDSPAGNRTSVPRIAPRHQRSANARFAPPSPSLAASIAHAPTPSDSRAVEAK